MTRLSIASLRPGINPIIVKELRSRMRGVRAFATLTGILAIMGGIIYVLYQITLSNARYSTTPLSPMVGQSLFMALAVLELILVCGITPAVTAGAISGEHERQTYDMLLATPLRPASLLWGKLIAALSYVFLLLFAAVPLASLVFIFGGVAPRDMLKTLVVLVAIAVFTGVLGLFMSALFHRTGRATVASYAVVLALVFGPLFIASAVALARSTQPARWILVPSPLTTLFSAMAPSTSGSNAGGMLTYLLGGLFGNLTGSQVSQTGIPRPLYHYSLPLYGLLTIVMYMIATRLVQPARRWRIRLKDALIGLGLVLGFVALVSLAFWRTSGRYEKVDSLFTTSDEMPPVIQPAPMVAVAVPAMVEPPMTATVTPTAAPYPPPDGEATGAYPAPGGKPTPTPLPVVSSKSAAPGLPVDQQAKAYAALVRQVLSGASEQPLILFLLTTTDDAAGASLETTSAPAEIAPEVREAMLGELAGLSMKVTWLSSMENLPTDAQTGQVVDYIAVISLGNIHLLPDGTVQVAASYNTTRAGSVGKTYTLAPKSGDWVVTGEAGG